MAARPSPPALRSLLFVADLSGFGLDTALAAGADALVLDLQGCAVGGAARSGVAEALARIAIVPARPRLFVRVNDLRSGLTDLDLDTVMPGRPDGILLPDTVGAVDVAQLGTKLAVREADLGWPDGGTTVLALTASARGVFGLGTLQRAGRRLAGIAWDAAPLSTDVGAATDGGPLPEPVRQARSLTLLAAAAAGVAAIDAPSPPSGPLDVLAATCAEAARDGFRGKLALHPDQVPVIHAAFGGKLGSSPVPSC